MCFLAPKKLHVQKLFGPNRSRNDCDIYDRYGFALMGKLWGPMHKIYKDFEQEPNFSFEAYDLCSHIKMRNALDIKMHTTSTQSLEYM